MKKMIILLPISLFIVCHSFANSVKENFDPYAISLIISSNSNAPFCYSFLIDYYPNGQVKEKGCQGHYNATGIFVGNWYEYDLLGMLIRTRYYHPDEFGKDYKIIITYDKNGKVLTKKIFNYSDLYETEDVEINEIPK
jgi:hypothetical protein